MVDKLMILPACRKAGLWVFSLLGFWFVCNPVDAQITAKEAIKSYPSLYSASDSLFLFADSGGKLLKVNSGQSLAVQTEWFQYDVLSGLFDIPLLEEVASASELEVDQPGGYRARLHLPEGIRDFHCWLYEPKMDSASITVTESGCYLLSLMARAWADTLRYIDPQTQMVYHRPQQLDVVWKTTPELEWNDTTVWEMKGLEPLYDSTSIQIVVTNEVGLDVFATLEYEPEAVLASFNYEQENRENPHEVDSPENMSAPAVVRFTSNSKGLVSVHEWTFGEAGKGFDVDPVYTFQDPGNYEVTLLVTNEKSGCEQQTEPIVLTVTDSYIGFPNVFSPNGDGINDEFRPTYKSLKSYSIVIYNRWGRKVYESNQIEEGWDGTIGGRKAEAGIYYFVAEASGYPKGDDHVRKGSVTLVR